MWTKKLEGTYAPSHAHFSPKSLDQNSEIAILFTIVEKPNNYVFGNDLLPCSPRRRGYKLQSLPVFTYSNGYWEVYRRFQRDFLFGGRVDGGGVRGRIFPWKNFSWGKRLSMKGAHDFLSLFTKTMKK